MDVIYLTAENASEYFAERDRNFEQGCKLLNTGVLNGVMDAYFEIAMKRAGLPDDKQIEILHRLHKVYDEYTAQDVLDIVKSAEV